MEKIKDSVKKSVSTFKSALPIMFGVLMLVSLLSIYLFEYSENIFIGNKVVDSFLGAIFGSISFGIPITSYVVGGELLKSGISLIAISAFILSWSTVGVAMLPLEARFLGKKFALIRNIINFIFSILIAYLTVVSVNIF
jgi:hypothetical protein